jgi:D-lactate dehydrogenase (cytochrome)
MNALVKLNEDDQDVVVQAGINWMDLNQKIKASGLWFPVDPAPGASIGGMVSMSCSGTNAYRYGTMKEWVLGLTVVLADGRVVKTRRRARKSSAGFDLTRLMIGAEGTLGVVTEAVLRLAPQPRNLVVGLVRFERVGQAVDVVLRVMRSGYKLEALELADGEQMRALNESELSEMRFEEKPTLFVKFAGPSKWVVQEQIEMVKELCRANGATKFEVTDEEDRMGTIWAARKSMAPALIKMKKRETDLFLHSDCAVPISKLPKLIEGTRELIERAAAKAGNGWFCANVGHVGDGNMHSSIICPAEDGAKAEAVLKEVARLALSLDGTITGEHGVGLELRDVLVEEVGEVGMDVMRRIKKSLDPRGILNPGKVLRLEDEGTQAKL